jgi:hypothetical protein
MGGEMIAKKVGNSFCVFFALSGTTNGITDERLGVSNVEVWVK